MHYKTLPICFAFLCCLVFTAVGAPVQSSQLTRRNYNTVQEAIHGIHHHVGSGTAGDVYSLKHKYQGHDAVIKVIDQHQTGARAPGPAAEAHNAHHVGQLLGYGHDTSHGRDTHYLVMKNMGVSAHKSGLSQQHIDKLNKEAEHRYKEHHGVSNRDRNGGNFVYHQHNGHAQAEIVDWARVEHHGTHPKVAPPHKEAVSLDKHHGKRKCPNCVIM